MIFYDFVKKLQKMEPNVCHVCIEKKKFVECCDYKCCIECTKNYLLDSTNDASCMSCKKKWNRNFLFETFGNTFVNKTYKKHREDILFEREISKFQATQVHVERQMKIEKLKKELNVLINGTNEEKEKTEVRKFIRKCPGEDCLGFLSSSLKCGLCNCISCKHCREIKNDNHECDPEILKNVEFMKKDSKPCPKCSSMIFKISGCSQMFCVECKIVFNWITLKISTGVIHNPHFFEYQRQNNNGVIPRNPLDIICGREIDYQFIKSLGIKLNVPTSRYLMTRNGNIMIIIAENLIHNRHEVLQRYTQNDDDNLKVRMDYILKKITKEQFKVLIQRNEKKKQKAIEMTHLIEMYIQCITDLLYRLHDNIKDYDSILDEMNELKKYTNKCFISISESYNSNTCILNEKFRMTKI